MLSLITAYVLNIFAKDTAIVKLPCDARVQETLNINQSELELAVVTSDNILDLVSVLVACGVEKAQVGGYNLYRLPMVLYNNGALVPYDVNRPVHYALYYYKCGCDYKIVCAVYSKDYKECKYYELCGSKSTVKEVCPPKVTYAPGIKEICPAAPVCPQPEIICPRPEPYCPPVPICPAPQPYCPPTQVCPYYSSNTVKCVKTPCGKRFSKITTAKTFKFVSPKCLYAYGTADIKSQEAIDLSRGRCANIPKLLCNYTYLMCVYQQLKSRYPGSLVCLFIDCNSCLYVKIDSCLYRIVCDGPQPLRTIPISSDEELKRITRKGLFGIEFDNC